MIPNKWFDLFNPCIAVLNKLSGLKELKFERIPDVVRTSAEDGTIDHVRIICLNYRPSIALTQTLTIFQATIFTIDIFAQENLKKKMSNANICIYTE